MERWVHLYEYILSVSKEQSTEATFLEMYKNFNIAGFEPAPLANQFGLLNGFQEERFQ